MAGKALVVAVLVSWTAGAAAEGPLYLGASYGLAYVDGTANTDSSISTDAAGLPEAIPLDGAPFDDDDGSWSAFVGYRINRYVALEAGYTGLGAFGVSADTLGGGELPTVEPMSIYLSARFRYPLTNDIFATWHAGFSETSFNVDGSVRVTRIGGPILGPILSFDDVPAADIDDETGYRWGFGFLWQFSEHFGTALDLTRHEIGVLDVDTVSLSLVFDL